MRSWPSWQTSAQSKWRLYRCVPPDLASSLLLIYALYRKQSLNTARCQEQPPLHPPHPPHLLPSPNQPPQSPRICSLKVLLAAARPPIPHTERRKDIHRKLQVIPEGMGMGPLHPGLDMAPMHTLSSPRRMLPMHRLICSHLSTCSHPICTGRRLPRRLRLPHGCQMRSLVCPKSRRCVISRRYSLGKIILLTVRGLQAVILRVMQMSREEVYAMPPSERENIIKLVGVLYAAPSRTATDCLLARYSWNADMISKLAHLLDAFYALLGSGDVLRSSIRPGYMRRCCVSDVYVFLVCTASMPMVLWPTLVHENPSANVSCPPLRLNC